MGTIWASTTGRSTAGPGPGLGSTDFLFLFFVTTTLALEGRDVGL